MLPPVGTKYQRTKKSGVAAHLVNDPSLSKRKNAEIENRDAAIPSSKKAKISGQQSTLSFVPRFNQLSGLPSPSTSDDGEIGLSPVLQKIISHTGLTPYRKRLYAALLSVPKGRYTTYAALSDFLGSSARAVGNGMRNNPFAPEVPCHRVLASDGSIGGFGGSWGIDGKNASKKLEMLKEEGIKFCSNGKVRGLTFKDFVNPLEVASTRAYEHGIPSFGRVDDTTLSISRAPCCVTSNSPISREPAGCTMSKLS